MKPRVPWVGLAALAPASLGIAVYLLLLRQTAGFTIFDHAFRPGGPALAGVSLAVLLFMAAGWLLTSGNLARRFSVAFRDVAARDAWSWSPFVALLLSPLTLAHYIGRDDLRARLYIFALVVVALSVYLKVLLFLRLRGAGRRAADSAREGRADQEVGGIRNVAGPEPGGIESGEIASPASGSVYRMAGGTAGPARGTVPRETGGIAGPQNRAVHQANSGDPAGARAIDGGDSIRDESGEADRDSKARPMREAAGENARDSEAGSARARSDEKETPGLRMTGAIPNETTEARKAFSRAPRVRQLTLFAAAFLVLAAGAVLLVAQGITFSGDEPHYLLMTYSLLEDGDLDLADDYEARAYQAYMQVPVTLQRHVVPGRAPGSQYSFHSPGAAFLMLPFYAVGSLLGRTGLILALRFGVALFGALFAVQLFLFLRRFTGGSGRAALLPWVVVVLATPVYFYGIHVYPELIVALLSLTIVRMFLESERLTGASLAWGGLLLASLIWFHALKYVFITGPLLLVCLWSLRRAKRPSRDFALFLAPFAVLTALYFVFQSALYGSASLSTVSWKGTLGGGETLAYIRSLFTDIPFRFRWETLAGYFFDQRDGLFFYAPVYVFGALGLLLMARRRARDFWTLAFIAAPYILVSAFLTQRTGYAPQARPLVAVIWVLAAGIAFFIDRNDKPLFAPLFAAAAAAGFAVTALLLRHPLALYQETTQGTTERGGSLFYVLSNLHFQVTKVLPSYIKTAEGTWLPNFIWIAAFATFVAAYFIAPRKGSRAAFGVRGAFGVHAALSVVAAVVVFAWLVLPPRVVLSPPTRVDYPSGEKVTFHSLSRVVRQTEPGRFLLPDDNRAYIFTFRSLRPLSELRLDFGSTAGDFEVEVRHFDAPVFSSLTARELASIRLTDPPGYAYGGTWLYWVTISIAGRSSVRTVADPYIFAITPVTR